MGLVIPSCLCMLFCPFVLARLRTNRRRRLLRLEDQGIVTQCKINTLDEVLMANFGFRTYPVVNRVVMKVRARCVRVGPF